MPLSIFVSKKQNDEFLHHLTSNPLEAYNPETGLRSNRVNTSFNDREGKFSVTMVGDSKRVCILLPFLIVWFVLNVVKLHRNSVM